MERHTVQAHVPEVDYTEHDDDKQEYYDKEQDEYQEQEEDDNDDNNDHVSRFCDAFVSDFDGTSALIVSSLESSPVHQSPATLAIVETLTEIVRNGDAWLPAETSERVESELLPLAVQLLLATAVNRDEAHVAVPIVQDLLRLVLERVASRLLYCDACLLPSLVRILDDQRSFYESGGMEMTATCSLYVDSGSPRVSSLYLRNLAHWGELGGFTLLLRCLQAAASSASRSEPDENDENDDHQATGDSGVFAFDAIQCIFRVLFAVKDHLARPFLTQFLTPLVQSARIYVTTMAASELASVPRDDLAEIVQIVELLVSHVADSELDHGDEQQQEEEEEHAAIVAVREAQVCVELLRLDLMLRFVTCPSLEKRIFGLVEIMDVATKASAAARSSQLNASIRLWLRENRVAELLFGETKHPELLKRCVPLLRFVMKTTDENDGAIEWIEAMWTCFVGKTATATGTSKPTASAGSTVATVIHDVVRGTMHSLLLEVVAFADTSLLQLLLEWSQASSRPLEGDVVSVLAATATKSDVLREPVLVFLWESLTKSSSSAISQAVADQALEEIAAIIRHELEHESSPHKADAVRVDAFLDRCVTVIVDSSYSSSSSSASSTSCSSQPVVLSLRLIEKLGAAVYESALECGRRVASRLVPTILEEFQEFKQHAHESTGSGTERSEDDEVYLNGIRVRLLALRSALIIAELARVAELATSHIVDSVWQLCIHQTLQSDESALFFQWIEFCFRTRLPLISDTGRRRRLLCETVALQLVETKFLTLAPTAMALSALCCFHHLFRKLNDGAQGGLVAHSANGVARTATSDDPDEASGHGQEEEDDEQDPEDVSDLLTGEPLVGMAGLWHLALHTADAVTAEEAITLLARLHLDFVPSLRGSEIAQQTKCAFVETCVSQLTRREDTDPALVNRSLDCLRFFIKASQADHYDETSAALDNDPVGASATTHSQRLDKYALENLEQKLQTLEIYPSPMKDSNSSIGNSGSSDSNHGVSPSRSMMMSGGRRPSWTFKQYHALLEAIQDEEDDPVGDSPVKSSLRRGELTIEIPPPVAERRLSIDTSVAGTIRPTQLTTSPSVQSRPDLQWIHGAQATPSASSMGPAFVIDALEVAEAAATDATASVAQLLVNRHAFVDTLFELVRRPHQQKERSDGSRDEHEMEEEENGTSKRAWGLLCQLPISTDVLQRMVRLRPLPVQASQATVNSECGAVVPWKELLDPSCVHRLLYSLRLVEALLLPLDAAKTADDAIKRQWRERFIRLGGASHLVEILQSRCGVQESVDSSVMALACLASVARILSYFARLSSTTSTAVDPASSFDARLIDSTLPQFFSSSDNRLESLLSAAATLVSSLSLARHSSQSLEMLELSATCAVELVCCLVPLNPSLAKSVVEATGNEGMAGWLQCVFTVVTTSHARSRAVDHLSTMGNNSDTAFAQKVLQSALDLAFCRDALTTPVELLELIVNLAPLLAQSPAIVRWTLDSRIILPSLLFKIQSSVRDGQSSPLRGNLRVLTAIASQSPEIKQAALAFRLSGDGGAVEGEQQLGIVAFIASHILWLSTSDDDGDAATGSVDGATRQAAHETLLQLSTDSLETTASVLKSLSRFTTQVQHRLSLLGRPWRFTPADELQDPATGLFAGLVNPGCVCYMNSLLQQLFMIPAFRHGLLQLDTSQSSASSWQSEIAELQKLFVSLTYSDRRVLDPTPFALSHRDLDGNPTDLNQQMDADEFFCLLLDRVETFLRYSQPPPASPGVEDPSTPAATPHGSSFLDQCFGGVLVNQILTEHGQLSEREEKFFALSLDISQKQQLTESLSLYVQGETLEGDNAYYCEHAQKKVSATKRVCIKTLPRTLVCHLKRFEFDFDTMEKIKIHDYLAFPDEIDMFPYTSEALATGTSSSPGSSCLYELVGIVVHSGSSDMGHYYSFIRDRRAASTTGSDDEDNEDSEKPTWLEFNDQTVKPFDVATMGDECFGGEEVLQKWDHSARAYVPVVQRKRRSAYMLIYEQRSSSVTQSEGSSAAVAVDCCWTNAPPSVQQLKNKVESENRGLRSVVHAAAAEHSKFLLQLVQSATICAPEEHGESSPEQDDDHDQERGTISNELLTSADTMAAVVACEHVFGVSSLLASDDDVGEDDDTISQIVSTVETWLCVPKVNHNDKETTKRTLFCEWLLRQVIHTKSASSVEHSTLTRRSWLFDLLFLCDKRPSLVQSCCSLLLKCLHFLTTTRFDHTTVAIAFLQSLVELFFDRDEIEINDPMTGGVYPVPQSSIIHGATVLGTVLRDCVTTDDTRRTVVLRDLILTQTCFLDRFLFSLQDSSGSSSSSSSSSPSSAAVTSRVRSSTFPLERQILRELFAGSPPTDLPSRLLEDPRLLLHQSVLKNMLTFQFDVVMTPLVVHLLTHQQLTRSQSDALVAALLAVLEQVKSTHLEQLLDVFGALLDIETDTELSSMQQRILSPTNGLLEAAAYYRDHRTLHEYAFLLVEFVATRAATSVRLQTYLRQQKPHVAWIQSWLVSYLDPHDTIRGPKQEEDHDQTTTEDDVQVLEQDVRALFAKAERGFGFCILTASQPAGRGAPAVDEDRKLFAVESLEDSDLSFSSDDDHHDTEENDDHDHDHDHDHDDGVARYQSPATPSAKKSSSHTTERHVVTNDASELLGRRDNGRTGSTGTTSCVVRSHMSSAA